MLAWSGIDPVAIQLGPLAIHWYGLMYIAGFMATWFLVRRQLMQAGLWQTRVSPEAYEGLFTALVLGVILGGRIGYVLFYNLGYFLEHPVEIVYVWQGGMSFHGGLVGPIIAGWWYCRRHALPFLDLADRFFTVAPLGLLFGRLGNFINGELWGRVVENLNALPTPDYGDFDLPAYYLRRLADQGLIALMGCNSEALVAPPGGRLLRVGGLPPSGVAFVLLALASVSFDGLSRTFWWLDLVGVNPLEYPGRSALVAANSLGLLAVFCALVGAYVTAVLLGRALADDTGNGDRLGRFVVSIVPIAFGYHFAHYLPTFLVDAQYALRALSDPLALGWDLFGTAHMQWKPLFPQSIIYIQIVSLLLGLTFSMKRGYEIAQKIYPVINEGIRSLVPLATLCTGITLVLLRIFAG